MLETLVSSRIRRTLYEHLLIHPQDRFYLRGLAKELGLSVTPLRRELKRLEHSGVLNAVEEGNMLFYTVNATSPLFQQLQQAGHPAADPALALPPQAIPVGVISADRGPSSWRSPLSGPAVLMAAGVGLALMLVVVGVFYLGMTNQQLVAQALTMLSTRKAAVTVVAPQPSASGAMRGQRWQVVPGGFGGFSSGSGEETY